ncbi:thyroid peroxidase-like [Styela clava]
MRYSSFFVSALLIDAFYYVTPGSIESDFGHGDEYASECMKAAKKKVHRAIQRTKIRWGRDDVWKNSMDLFEFFKRPPTPESFEIARAADVFETTVNFVHDKLQNSRVKRRVNATDVLSSETLQELARFAGCKGNKKLKECPRTCQANKYRTINGECNNLNMRHWGASNNPFERWLPSQYENNFNLPMGWDTERRRNGFKLPMVRKLSNDIMHTANTNVTDDSLYSHMLVVWGQYIDHDFDLTPQSLSTSTFQGLTDCKTTCTNSPPCFPIMIPGDDQRIRSARCMPFFRSAAVCGTGETSGFFNGLLPREQINAVTSFVDASTVYGSTEAMAESLRDRKTGGGLMLVNDKFKDNGREYLPFNPNNPCVQDPSDASGEKIPCFHAGDGRVSEHLTLSGLHTLWLREHNRLARALKTINPHWHEEKLYQEARKIVGSLHQVVQYREYIPKVIGARGVQMMGNYNGYSSSANPSISNVFATAAFRFGHVTIAPMFRRLNESYQEHQRYKNIFLHKAFFSPWRIIREGGFDPIFRGLIGKPAKLATPTQIMHEELREKLFQLQNKVALDLSSLNLQRGRDHALPLYNDWREFCNMSRVGNFSEVMNEIKDEGVRRKLEELYGHPGNIDLWLAGLVEDLIEGSRVGPIFMCLLAKQFKYQRDGDRFFYLNNGVHTQAQRNALENVRLAHVICANTGLKKVQLDAFRVATFPRDFVDCNTLRPLNLEPWRETNQIGNCGKPRDITNGVWSLCDSNTVTYMCNKGYQLQGSEEVDCMSSGQYNRNPPQCNDINECGTNNGGCMVRCTNTPGSYMCACGENQKLNEDGKSCSDKKPDDGPNVVAIVTGVVLGVAVVGVFIALSVGIYKYTKLQMMMKPNSRFKITDSIEDDLPSRTGVDNPAASTDKM